MKNLALITCFVLGGCATLPDAAPEPVAGARPKIYAGSEFHCQSKPVPPDRTQRRAAPAQKYIDRLEARGDDCSNQLDSVGRKAAAAGLVN